MAKNGNIHPTRIFETPEDLLKAWEEYKVFKDSQASKWAKVQYVGREGERRTDNPPMPYDIDGFKSWYYNNNGKFIHQYFKNKDGYYDDFVPIVTHIKDERNDNIKTGTLLGFFNASMGNRIAELVDKKETEIKGGLNIPNLPDIGKR